MISIVTVTHNSTKLLDAYVESFLAYNWESAGKGVIEFIFVENSGDRGIDVFANTLRGRGFDVRVLMVPNRGFGAGCNAGACAATGRILVFANPDIHFLSDIAPIDSLFSNSQWGTVRQERGSASVYSFDLLPEYRRFATELLRPGRFIHKVALARRFSYPVGAFMVVPRDAFLRAGAFDERFFLYYEEAELSRRLHSRLGPPIYAGSVSIFHDGFGTQKDSDFTLREEAKGFVTYASVTAQPALAEQQLRRLKRLAFVSRGAARRMGYLREEMQRRGARGHFSDLS